MLQAWHVYGHYFLHWLDFVLRDVQFDQMGEVNVSDLLDYRWSTITNYINILLQIYSSLTSHT